jgi:hypothetical protein
LCSLGGCMKREVLLAAVLSACFGSAEAQTASPPQTPEPPPIGATQTPTSTLTLPADTPVRIELTEAVGSNGRARGDKFGIKLSSPILVNGQMVAPAGATGMGEVVYAEAAGMGGAPGKLVLAARYVDVGSVRVRLKALNLSAGGESEFRELQVAGSLIGPVVLFVDGHNVLYPIGTRARAKVGEDIALPILPQDTAIAPPTAVPATPVAAAAAPTTPLISTPGEPSK